MNHQFPHPSARRTKRRRKKKKMQRTNRSTEPTETLLILCCVTSSGTMQMNPFSASGSSQCSVRGRGMYGPEHTKKCNDRRRNVHSKKPPHGARGRQREVLPTERCGRDISPKAPAASVPWGREVHSSVSVWPSPPPSLGFLLHSASFPSCQRKCCSSKNLQGITKPAGTAMSKASRQIMLLSPISPLEIISASSKKMATQPQQER